MSDYMSIRLALESAVNDIRGSVVVAWENKKFKPTAGTPYLGIFLLPAQSQNPSIGDGHILETGILQVTPSFPAGGGTAPAGGWATTIRNAFPRGRTITRDGITVTISKTPSIAPALTSPDWYRVPVSIPYYAHLFA